MKLVFFSLIVASLFSFKQSEVNTLYHSLDPSSLVQALAFYELYGECDEGFSTLSRAAKLVGLEEIEKASILARLINRKKGEDLFSEEELSLIESLGENLPNRKLKGYFAKSEEEIFSLSSSEIDLGKALLFSQMKEDPAVLQHARNYSALLDLMAIRILSKLSSDATVEEKIEKTNQLIFDEMHFRFPPQSLYAEEIDKFTFLPSVMDDHLGVCLGVTALYLAIAQRIDLPLEIITPPGHIYVRYVDGEKLINIETTARGVNTPTESYLGIATPSLAKRDLKEVIGMTHVNQASIYLQSKQFEKAAISYEKALPFMPNDPLVKELLGYSYLLSGREGEGKALLLSVQNLSKEDPFVRRRLVEDFLKGKVGVDGVAAIFTKVDETRESILSKIKELKETITHYPSFREGFEQLATCWIQLKRTKEALLALQKYHELDAENPVIEYYLAVLYGERHDFKNSWRHLTNALEITSKKGYLPRALKEVRLELNRLAPV